MSSIYDWSQTAADNANSDSAINWAEGMAPSGVNNSARALEGRVAEILADMGGALTAGGTANALTVTANSAFTAHADGLMLALRIATDNTTAATLNVNGLGAKSIRKMLASGESALTGAELQATGIYLFRYSTALNSAAGGWLLLNPTIDVTPYATIASPTFTGTPAAPTATAGTNTTQIATTAFATGAISTAISALSTVYQAASAVLTALAGVGTAVAGDIIYATGAGAWGRLAKGTARQSLLMNAGATAPSWVTLPFTKSFESSQQTVTGNGALTLAHSLGAKPKLYQAYLICVTGEAGYTTGDEVIIDPSVSDPGSSRGISLVPDATNINVRFGSAQSVINASTGAWSILTNANWKLVVRAWA